jgi:adenylate kinase family enzyme
VRVAILGNSGSGKSTLARWLASRGGAPSLDLDTVAWVAGQIAVERPIAAARADVRAFCESASRWVVEGCYTSLVRVALEHRPRLLFLNPGLQQCIENCRSRPWEPHKYSSETEQDDRLGFLLGWVTDYYSRDGDLSYQAHRACFDEYAGPKQEVTDRPRLDPPSDVVLAWAA